MSIEQEMLEKVKARDWGHGKGYESPCPNCGAKDEHTGEYSWEPCPVRIAQFVLEQMAEAVDYVLDAQEYSAAAARLGGEK